MKVLVFGATGQLGQSLQQTVPAGIELTTLSRPQVDYTDAISLQAAIRSCEPHVVINAAAYTAVDHAEAERDLAFSINSDAVEAMADACRAGRARMVHVSTDYVFNGKASRPWRPDDKPDPLSVYGASKLAGERHLQQLLPKRGLIVRTGWLYRHHGHNFLTTMLKLMQKRKELNVVSDQFGTPTAASSLAHVLWKAATMEGLSGIYHWSDAGVASWYDFAVAIQEEALVLALLDYSVPINPVNTRQYPTPAHRPAFSVLDKSDSYPIFAARPVHWRVNLRTEMKKVSISA